MKLLEFLSFIKGLNLKKIENYEITIPQINLGVSEIRVEDHDKEINLITKPIKKLKTLEESEKQAHNSIIFNSIYTPKLNGIECSKCGNELYDTEPGVLYLSNPPKTKINCAHCGYSGTRTC